MNDVHGNRFAAAARRSQGADLAQFSSLGSAVSIVMDFPWQSSFLYTTFPTGGQSNVLPQQPSSRNINPSTQITQQVQGRGFALHPSSETPIAILPISVKGASNSAAVILKPGQVYYPGGEFRSFTWGLPYGWLGGGLANLLVFREENGYAFWAAESEVLFHRLTVPIFVPAADVQTPLPPPNWPLRFPWPYLTSTFGGGNVPAVQPPQLAVTPTRYVIRLVSNTNGGIPTLGAGVTTRLTLVQTRDMDVGITAAVQSTDQQSPGAAPAYATPQGYNTLSASSRGSSINLQWNQWAPSGLIIGTAQLAEDPVQTLNADALRGGGDQAVLIACDPDGVLTNGAYALEIARYGRIGG